MSLNTNLINKYFLSILLLLTLCFLTTTANTKDIKPVANLTEKPDNSFLFKEGIISIFEDSKGNFWVGTKDKGLSKFDGKTYQYYSTKDGLPHNQINNIKEDSNGNIVFQTGKGMSSYDGDSFKDLEYHDSQLFVNTWEPSGSSLWYATGANGVLKYNGSHLEVVKYPFSDIELTNGVHFPYSTIETYKDNHGKMWFGTFNQGVIEYDEINFKKHNPDDFGVGTIRSIFQDKNGNHWMGSNGGGLYKYDGKTYRNFTKEKGLTSSKPGYDEAGTLSRVWAIQQDNKDNMWFGTADSGVWLYDGDSLINYTIENGLPSNFVDIIYKDSKGGLWFGSGLYSNAKLSRFNGKSFEIFNGFDVVQ